MARSLLKERMENRSAKRIAGFGPRKVLTVSAGKYRRSRPPVFPYEVLAYRLLKSPIAACLYNSAQS